MSTVNLAEVVGYLARNGTSGTDIGAMTDDRRLTFISFDERLAHTAGRYLPMARTAGLSLGDRACLALADMLTVPALTTDQSWSRIAAAVSVEVEVIR